MKKLLILIVVLVLVGAGYYFLFYKNSSVTQEENNGEVTAPPVESAVKEFTVEGQDFSFSPANLTVKVGDTVKVTFKNVKGVHDFRIDEFGVATEQMQTGEEQTVEFVTDKAGSFEYYCSIGRHREMGMKGTLTVEE